MCSNTKLVARAALSPKRHGASADTCNPQDKPQYVTYPARRKKVTLDARHWNTNAFSSDLFHNADIETFSEPVFYQLVEEDKVLRIEDNPGRVAMVESNEFVAFERGSVHEDAPADSRYEFTEISIRKLRNEMS